MALASTSSHEDSPGACITTIVTEHTTGVAFVCRAQKMGTPPHFEMQGARIPETRAFFMGSYSAFRTGWTPRLAAAAAGYLFAFVRALLRHVRGCGRVLLLSLPSASATSTLYTQQTKQSTLWTNGTTRAHFQQEQGSILRAWRFRFCFIRSTKGWFARRHGTGKEGIHVCPSITQH